MSHFLDSSVVGHLGCFHSFPIVNSVGVNMGVQVSQLHPDLHSFGYMPRIRITGSPGSSAFNLFEESPYCFPQWLY
jgi:hypothetical protein